MDLTGTEIVEVRGQSESGAPSGATFRTTTQDIANLGGGAGGNSVIMNNWPGVTTGSGQDQATRQANAVAMQEAIDYAIENDKTIEVWPDIFEIENAAGLVTGQGGQQGYSVFKWRGDYADSKIIQFQSNAPCLSIGDTSGIQSSQIDFDGVFCGYGADQTGQTSASAFRIGSTWRSWIRGVQAGEYNGHRPYRSCQIMGGGSKFYFSNILENCTFGQAQYTCLAINNHGTGNVFRNLYVVGDGAPDTYDLAGPLFEINNSFSAQYGNVFEQLNLEWAKTNSVMKLSFCRGNTFISTHFEGNRLTGLDPQYIYMEGSNVVFTGTTALNNYSRAADGVTGTASFIKSYYTGSAHIDTLEYFFDDTGGSYVDAPFTLLNQGTYQTSDLPTAYRADNLIITDTNTNKITLKNMRMTNSTTDNAFQNGTNYKTGFVSQVGALPTLQNSMLQLVGDYTLYGLYKDAYLSVPTTITTTRTVTLSNVLSPSGSLFDTVPTAKGNTVSIYRSSGVAGAGNLVIKNHDGTTLATITTSDTFFRGTFDGTDWIDAT